MTQPSNPEVVCATCGERASGRFCSNCGSSLEAAACTACGTALSPAARFCHNCGQSTGIAPEAVMTPAAKPASSASFPWIVSVVALVVLLAFIAGSVFNKKRGSSPDAQNALPQTSLGAGPGIVRASDISQLSPQESADRLFNRVMLLDREGKSDSVLFFAPMAIQAFEMIGSLDAGQRYEMGRIAEVAGDLNLAKAEVDTILRNNPSHLLGLVLAEDIATTEKRSSDAASYKSRLRAAYPAESARKLPEYDRHRDDISRAIDGAAPKKSN